MNPRTRLDKFASNGSSVYVQSRNNALISTQSFITQDCNCEAYNYKEKEDDFDLQGFEGFTKANIEPVYENEGDDDEKDIATTVKVIDFPLNKSMYDLHFQPETCQNTLNVFPEAQRKLLPYLCEKQSVDNVLITDSLMTDRTFSDDFVDQAYLYDPRVAGGYFFRLTDSDDDEKAVQPRPIIQKHGCQNSCIREDFNVWCKCFSTLRN